MTEIEQVAKALYEALWVNNTPTPSLNMISWENQIPEYKNYLIKTVTDLIEAEVIQIGHSNRNLQK